jgi:hypothetical protein
MATPELKCLVFQGWCCECIGTVRLAKWAKQGHSAHTTCPDCNAKIPVEQVGRALKPSKRELVKLVGNSQMTRAIIAGTGGKKATGLQECIRDLRRAERRAAAQDERLAVLEDQVRALTQLLESLRSEHGETAA